MISSEANEHLAGDLSISIGATARLERTLAVDVTMREVFWKSGAAEAGCAIVALGSYGRQEMAPGSDLDFVLLQPEQADIGQVVDDILYPLWDSKLKLDYSVRTVGQSLELANLDLRVVLGLLDSRFVVGDSELATALKSQVLALWRKTARNRLPELFSDMDLRSERFGELSYLLEPNLKEAAGGLRDANILQAIDSSWVVDTQHRILQPVSMHLLDVRDALHLSTGQSSDVLTRHDQVEVARLLNYKNPDELLRRLLAAGRTISWQVDQVRGVVEHLIRPRRTNLGLRSGVLKSPTIARVPLANGVVLHGSEVALAQAAQVETDAGLTMRLAAAAAATDSRISPYSIQRLAQAAPVLTDPWPRQVRESFVSFIGAGRGTLRVWEMLDQVGIISQLLPEWERLRSAPQHDPIHIYTVDRHSIECVINAASLVRTVARPDLLLVGALLHDIGKGRGGDHCQLGVQLVEQVARRMGFNTADIATLSAMVRLHLLLPEVAITRDLSDPLTIDFVANMVGSVELLELLEALAEADSLATGPGVWTRWKATLLTELATCTRAKLLGVEVVREQSEPDWEALVEAGLCVTLTDQGELPVITVFSVNRLELLADISGLLTRSRLQVRAAEIKTHDGYAYSSWVVEPEFGDRPEVARIREDLRLLELDSIDLPASLEQRARSYLENRTSDSVPPRVEFVSGASESASVLEVRAGNMPGLVSVIARAIGQLRIDIVSARAATLGDNAVDSFYLQCGGNPLVPDQLNEVRQAVTSRLARLWQVI